MVSDDSEDMSLEELWEAFVLYDAETELKVNRTRPPIFLDRDSRCWVWRACTYLDLLEYGVPGQVCRLIEFYMGEKVREFAKTKPTKYYYLQFRTSLNKRFPLNMAAALIIATKLYHNTRTIDPVIALDCLRVHGFNNYTPEQIKETVCELINIHGIPTYKYKGDSRVVSPLEYQFDVHKFETRHLQTDCSEFTYIINQFKMIALLIEGEGKHHVRFPIWSTVQTAELIAAYADIPVCAFNFMQVVANVAEFMRYRVDVDLRQSLTENIFGTDRVSALNLAAASAYTAAKHFGYDTPETLPLLAYLTSTSNIYLLSLSNLLLYYTESEEFP